MGKYLTLLIAAMLLFSCGRAWAGALDQLESITGGHVDRGSGDSITPAPDVSAGEGEDTTAADYDQGPTPYDLQALRAQQDQAEKEKALGDQQQFNADKGRLLQGLKTPGASGLSFKTGTPRDLPLHQNIPGPAPVDVMHVQQAACLARALETASSENVSFLLFQAIKTANGDNTYLGNIPAGTVLPVIGPGDLALFKTANADYLAAKDELLRCSQALEAVKGDHAAWLMAKARFDAAAGREYQTWEEAIRILRAFGSGKEPAQFHPPLASLPALDGQEWAKTQTRMDQQRQRVDGQVVKFQKEILAYKVPPLKFPEDIHEGVILGFASDSVKADDLQHNGTSPFLGKAYKDMDAQGQKVMVVSFGTPSQDQRGHTRLELGRILRDHFTLGEESLNTPQAKEALEKLKDKKFDRLIAHSNGASVTEALIRNDIITVDELNIVGGDNSLLRGHAYQQLLDSGKVKRVVVWINANDLVPGLTAVDSTKVALSMDTAMHLTRKLTNDLAAGNAGVEYRFMYGPAKDHGKVGLFVPHYLEESYYPNIAKELGVDYHGRNDLTKE